jgi:hypothetical protein
MIAQRYQDLEAWQLADELRREVLAMETQDLLIDGIERRYFTEQTTRRARDLAKRSLQVSKGLMRYLKSCRNRPSKRPRTSA